jgi:hypothetical protein
MSFVCQSNLAVTVSIVRIRFQAVDSLSPHALNRKHYLNPASPLLLQIALALARKTCLCLYLT